MNILKRGIALGMIGLLLWQPADSIMANSNNMRRTGILDGNSITSVVTAAQSDITTTANTSTPENSSTVEEKYADYTKISTWQELNNIRNNLSGKYVLTADITWPDNQNWIPIESFSGVLDGNNHRVNHLTMHQKYGETIQDGDYSYWGLFSTTKNATICNLALTDIDFDLDVSKLYSHYDSENKKNIGGLVGYQIDTQIDNCYVTGNIKAVGDLLSVGGFTGRTRGYDYVKIISNCYSVVNIDVKGTGGINLAGFTGGSFGYRGSSFDNCYSISRNITQNEFAKYGFGYYANTSNCYYLEEAGLGDDHSNATSMTETKMQELSNFVGYENTGLWIVDDTSSYPYPQLINNPQVRVTNIEFTDMGDIQNTYTIGDKMTIGDAYITVTYEDGSVRQRKVTEGMVSGLDLNKSGVQTGYVKWLNGTAPFTVNVKEVEAKSVSLDCTKVQLDIYKTKQLTAAVSPDNTTDKSITWSSDNTNVATVSDTGLVKAVNLGRATITASTANGVIATCEVEVGISVKSFILNETEATLVAGDILELEGVFNPMDATLTDLTWQSTDENVAVVSDEGKVTAMTSGSTTIIATTVNGLTAECDISVTIPASKIKVNVSSITLNKGKSKQLTVKIYPSNASDKPKFSSSNKKVATVTSKGKVTAKKKGTAYIEVVVGNCIKKVKVKVK